MLGKFINVHRGERLLRSSAVSIKETNESPRPLGLCDEFKKGRLGMSDPGSTEEERMHLLVS